MSEADSARPGPDEAEVEAVKRRLRGEAVRVDENNPDVYFVPLGLALDALDEARSSQPKTADAWSWGGEDLTPPERSPQGEDHEGKP